MSTRSALTLGKIERLSARFFEALERLSFIERQVNKIYKFKAFFNIKFV
jgi:hypothetical protein